MTETDAWAIGTHTPLPKGIYPLTEHWDGRRWRAVPCPSPGGTRKPARSSLAAVAIDAPGDAWAVGSWSPIEHNAPSYPLMEHWNGTKWSIVPGPRARGYTTTSLTAVAAISPTAAWAIGAGTARGRQVTVFMGWDGIRWRYLPRPASMLVPGLAVISARDIWVVGTRVLPNTVAKHRTLAQHWNGSKWTIVPTPNEIKGRARNSNLYAVSGSSSSNVWAVGDYGSTIGLHTSTLVEHWDGARWQAQPSPNGPPGAQGERGLSAIAALGRTSALSVGSYGAGTVHPLTERWNGVRWTTVPNKLQPGVTSAYLTSVAAVNSRYAWAIGEGDQYQTHISFIEKWNGTTWHQLPNPLP